MRDTFPPFASEHQPILQKIGELVVRWNDVEAMTRLLLFGIINPGRPGHRVDVLTANLSNVALADAIRAISDDYEATLRNHFRHAAAYFDVLRQHRNNLVHDPSIGAFVDGDPIVVGQGMTSKGGRLKRYATHYRAQDFDGFLRRTVTLRTYINDLVCILWQMPNAPEPALLEKPALPELPKKLFHNIIQHQSLPESLQG